MSYTTDLYDKFIKKHYSNLKCQIENGVWKCNSYDKAREIFVKTAEDFKNYRRILENPKSGYFKYHLDWEPLNVTEDKVKNAAKVAFYILIEKASQDSNWNKVGEWFSFLVEVANNDDVESLKLLPYVYNTQLSNVDVTVRQIYNGLGLLNSKGNEIIGDTGARPKECFTGGTVSFDLSNYRFSKYISKRTKDNQLYKIENNLTPFDEGVLIGYNWRNIPNLVDCLCENRNKSVHGGSSIPNYSDEEFAGLQTIMVFDYITTVYYLIEYLNAMNVEKPEVDIEFVTTGLTAVDCILDYWKNREAFPEAFKAKQSRTFEDYNGIPEKAADDLDRFLKTNPKQFEEFISSLQEKFDKTNDSIESFIAEYIKKEEEKRKRRRRNRIVTICCLAVLLSGAIVATGIYCYRHSVMRADKLYEQAIAGEPIDTITAPLYRNAVEIYRDNAGSLDSARNVRTAMMLMRGKGGTTDLRAAREHAAKAGRHDLEAYICAADGYWDEAVSIINLFPNDTSDYMRLAHAMTVVDNPYAGISDRAQASECVTVIDSLAGSASPARQEALEVLFSMKLSGVFDSESSAIVYPSLFDAINTAKTAVNECRSLNADLFIATIADALGMPNTRNMAENRLANKGYDPAVHFPSADQALEFARNKKSPAAMIDIANANYRAGRRYYNTTARFYHLADSIMGSSHNYITTRLFYERYADMIAASEDLKTVEQIKALVKESLPDSIRSAVAHFVMAMKYSEGKGGVSQNDSLAKLHMAASADLGLKEAVIWKKAMIDGDGTFLDSREMTGDGDLMKLLYRMSHNTVDRQFLESYSEAHPFEPNGIAATVGQRYLWELPEEERIDLYNRLRTMLAANHNSLDNDLMYWLAGVMASVSASLDLHEEAEFYLELVEFKSTDYIVRSRTFFLISETLRRVCKDRQSAQMFMAKAIDCYLSDPEVKAALKQYDNLVYRTANHKIYNNIGLIATMVLYLYDDMWEDFKAATSEMGMTLENDSPVFWTFDFNNDYYTWSPADYPDLTGEIVVIARPTLSGRYW